MNAVARTRAWIAGALAGDSERGIPIAETVQWVSLVYGGMSLLAMAAVLLAFPDSSWRLLICLASFALSGTALALVRYGRPRTGAVVLVSSCWLSLLLALALTGGVSIAANTGFVLAICSAGLLLGRRIGLALAGLSAIAGPAVVGMHFGATSSPSGAETYAEGIWLMQAVIFFSAAALVSITVSHAQRALSRARRSESRFRALSENMQDVIIEFDAEDRFAYVNPAFLRRSGLRSVEELTDKRLGFGLDPGESGQVTRELRRVRDEGGSSRFSVHVTSPGLDSRIVEVSASGIVGESGERRVVTVSRDVTAQRAVEDALRDSEERYRMLAEHAPDMIVEHDETGGIVYANPAARANGIPDGATPENFGEWNHPDDVEKCRKAFADAMSLGRVIRIVHRLRQKDGNYRWVASSGAPYRTSKGEMRLVGQSRDISEEIALQEQLRQAQKMEAIGRLAGGVAHDFNNLLTVIGGYAGVLEASAALDPSAHDAAREIAAAAERAAGLTRQLLALSKRQLAKSQIVDLNETVRGLEPVLRRTLPESIELELELDPDLPRVEADPSQLDQVLLNLALNARDAMPARGRLRIETRRGESGHSLHLLVSDTGVGMAESTRLRAFEPFFTTKDVGEGSGLGLSTTYGIVQQIGGSIELDSAPGCGTRVSIELPAASSAAARVTSGATAPHGWPARDAAILLVEDDPSVRRLLTLMLQGSGYRVFSAGSGDEALALVESGALAVDAVLSDYVLPGISGVELCAALRRRFPTLRVLLMTGHAEIPPAGAVGLPEGAELLGKPFTREQLEQMLARQLAAS